MLDSDTVHHAINREAGSSVAGRMGNVCRLSKANKLMVDAEPIVVAVFSPFFKTGRVITRERLRPAWFIDVFVDMPLEVCEAPIPGTAAKRRAET